MILLIDGLFTAPEVEALRNSAEQLAFSDGARTAGRFARSVKANEQAEPSDDLAVIEDMVGRRLMSSAIFQSAARPRAMTRLILSRYGTGQTYGPHVDDAIMGAIRTDLSFTLFLSDPAAYDGGALLIEDTAEERAFRPEAGELVLYPSTTLHRVEPVTRGLRYAIVGWVQSWIRTAERREILFDLDHAIEGAHRLEGDRALLDKLLKTRSNLIRLWAGD